MLLVNFDKRLAKAANNGLKIIEKPVNTLLKKLCYLS